MRVRDPQNVLAAEYKQKLEADDRQGVVIVAPHSPPIPVQSIDTIFSSISEVDEILYFVPEIPTATELGLPPYPPVLFHVPDRLCDHAIAQELTIVPFAPLRLGRTHDVELRKIVLASVAEQEHYFATHFGHISKRPRQASVVLSNRCNLHCVMCPYHGPQQRKRHLTKYFETPMPTSNGDLDLIAAELGRNAVCVKIGNIEEPLLHPYINTFISNCRAAGSPGAHITTNGTLLNAAQSDALLNAGLTSLYVSLDAAYPQTYARTRNGSLEKVEENLRYFVDQARKRPGPCTIMASLVLNPEVTPEEKEAFSQRWLPVLDGVIFYQLATYEQKRSTIKAHAVANEKIRHHGGRWPCLNPWQEVYLMPDHKVYYCCETIAGLAYAELESLGDYTQSSLTEIWLGESFTHLRRDLIRGELAAWPTCCNCSIWMAHVCSSQSGEQYNIIRNIITEIRTPKK